MKRFAAIIISLILVLSIGAGFAENTVFGPKYRFESRMNEVEIKEPVYNHQFMTLSQFLTDIEDQFGYRPDAEIDYENRVVTVWFYNSVAHVECVIANEKDEENRRVLIPDIYFDDSFVEYNELYSTIGDDRDYEIHELETNNYVVDSIQEDKFQLKLYMYSNADDKLIRLKIKEYTVENGKIFVSARYFRQFWFEVYKQDQSRE